MRLILIGVAVVSAIIAVLFFTSRAPSPVPAPPPRPVPDTVAAVASPPPAEERGPLAGLEPDLRRAIDAALAEYQGALESRDATRLARVRPDLTIPERERMLARFAGALNVGVDLRVLDVRVLPAEAMVVVLRTEVVVGGSGGERAPEEETLRFERRPEGWVLGARRH